MLFTSLYGQKSSAPMALLDLFSVFYFNLKNSVTASALTGHHHAFALCLSCIRDRHFISAYWTLYPDKPFYFLNIIHPLQHTGQVPAIQKRILNRRLPVILFLRQRQCIQALHFSVKIFLLL